MTNDFFGTFDPNPGKEYKFKILVWPNITYQENLSKDSYVVVLRKVIEVVNGIRDDIHWTIVSPSHIPELQFPNTHQIFYDLPTNRNLMRCHFNVIKVKNTLDLLHTDYDIVYSHLPEHTLQLSNLIRNHSGLRPKIIGYCHWYEVEENSVSKKSMLGVNLLGTLEMETCGLNSEWLKNRVLSEARKILSVENASKLETILQPQYLGTDIDFSPVELPQIPKSILFNSRSDGYTGWPQFLTLMDELWKKRQDFKVYMTFDCDETRPYLTKIKLPKKSEYYELIKRMSIGVGMFRGYSAWSLSVMDGLGHGLPYLLPNDLCYPEMVGKYYPLFYSSDSDLLIKLERILDTPDFKYRLTSHLKTICEQYVWNDVVAKWFDGWKIFDRWKKMEHSDTYPRIVEYIKKNGHVTKHGLVMEFNWGRTVDYAYYRNMLRDDPNIKMLVDGYEYREL